MLIRGDTCTHYTKVSTLYQPEWFDLERHLGARQAELYETTAFTTETRMGNSGSPGHWDVRELFRPRQPFGGGSRIGT